MRNHGRSDLRDVEGQSLEERHSVLTLDLLEHDSELVCGDLLHKVTLELNDDVVTGKNRAESVALVAEETKSVAFEDQRVVETCFDGGLGRHNSEVVHVFETLVSDLNGKGESLSDLVNLGGANLFELNLRLKFFYSLLDHGVLRVKNIDD